MLKRLVIAAALVLGLQGAQAATLDNIEVIVTAPPLLGSGDVTSDGSGGVFFSGSGVILADFFVPVFASDLSFSAFPAAPNTKTLTAGAALDVGSSAGIVQFLYEATSNTVGPDYNLFRVTLLHAGGDLLTTEQHVPLPASITVDAVRELAPIPLPATLPLVLLGIGGLAFAARKKSKS